MKRVKGWVAGAFATIGGLGLGSWAAADDKPAGTVESEMKRMDANADQRVSPDEHAAYASSKFDSMDTDKDGRVTAVEMQAAHEKMGKKAKGTSASDKIKSMDTNNDGALSADEYTAGKRSKFDAMDTNTDGFLSKTELASEHAEQRK
jgi:Ca2+-binding EF-hand superfamily protein